LQANAELDFFQILGMPNAVKTPILISLAIIFFMDGSDNLVKQMPGYNSSNRCPGVFISHCSVGHCRSAIADYQIQSSRFCVA